ncbi:MAG: ATP-binding protein [Bacillota bacterium]
MTLKNPILIPIIRFLDQLCTQAARRELNRDQLLMLGSCRYIADARNVIIMGAAGSGKSFVACALGMEACKQSYSVRFVRMPTLMEELKLAAAIGKLQKTYKQYTKVNLLIAYAAPNCPKATGIACPQTAGYNVWENCLGRRKTPGIGSRGPKTHHGHCIMLHEHMG